MAGLFDRLDGTIEDGVQMHYLIAGIKGYGTGIWPDRAQVLAAVNSLLVTPLDAGEQADFTAIADMLDGQPNSVARLGYVNQVEAAIVAAEAGVINDAGWRSALEIS